MKFLLVALIALLPLNAYAVKLRVKSDEAGLDVVSERVAFIKGDINNTTYERFKAQMERTSDKPGPRIIIINSVGGLSEPGEKIIGLIEAEKQDLHPVVCVVTHQAYSMAFNILTHCDVRLTKPKATLLFHKLSYGTIIEQPDHRLTAKVLRDYADTLDADDEKYLKANTKALNMRRKEYEMHAEHDTKWKPDVLIKRKYLHGIARTKIIKK